MALSAIQRSNDLARVRESSYDLAIVGGGITGAGAVLDAVSRGLKVLLVEKEDFAWGTSSRSTKLIHGGLRYLKQLDIALVREVGRERAIIHHNAPHLVHPEELLLPLIENGSLGKYTTPVGLWMYEKLAGVSKQERFRMLDRKEALESQSLLNGKIVKGAAIYKEYRTDDARLVISLLKTAAAKGADILNYTRVTGFTYQEEEDKRVRGLQLKDELGGGTFEVNARIVINAAGPWCDEVRRYDSPVGDKRLRLTKGIHLVFPHEKLPLDRAVYFDVSGDNRMIFAIPRDRVTYVGTTDTLYRDDIDKPGVSKKDVSYILAAINFMFPSLQLKKKDVESTWSGLRPLIHEEGKGPSELSRKDEVFITDSGLISIAGGKLTGYRKMAERVVDLAMTRLTGHGEIRFEDCVTEEIVLEGGDFGSYGEVKAYKQQLHAEGMQIGLTAADANHLVNCYGRKAEEIIEIAYASYQEITDHGERLLKAEMRYCIENEMVHNLCDFFIRRTGRLYFNRPAIKSLVNFAKEALVEHLQIDEIELQKMTDLFTAEYKAVLDFSEK